jgi:hypothetical protein
MIPGRERLCQKLCLKLLQLGIVEDFSRSCLPVRNSRLAAACRDFGACICAKQPTNLNDVQTRFALRQYENPFRQKGPTLAINREQTETESAAL